MEGPSTYLPLQKHDPETVPSLSQTQSQEFSTKPRSVELPRRTKESWLELWSSLGKSLLLPVIAAAYLAFCFTVQKRVVQVDTGGLIDISPEHYGTIKSAVTSISILVIALGLWPLYSLIQDLKSEEFFRLLTRSHSGVALSTISSISTPNYGMLQSIITIIQLRCSPYFFIVFVATFVATAISILAPAALSVELVTLDGPLQAFTIGGILPNSVINTTDPDMELQFIWDSVANNVSANVQQAASLTWAESALGFQWSFSPPRPDRAGVTSYIVPVPLDLPVSTPARWITDVISINPKCTWEITNHTEPFVPPPDADSFTGNRIAVNLPRIGVDVQLMLSTVAAHSMFNHTYGMVDPWTPKNSTTGDPASGGLTLWVLGQCSDCQPDVFYTPFNIDFSGVPTFAIKQNRTTDVAILACFPNPVVETHEIRNNGQGVLSIMPKPRMRQGNIDPNQVDFLLTYILNELKDAGPSLNLNAISVGMGSQLAATLILGKEQIATRPDDPDRNLVSWKLIPEGESSVTYARFIQSGTKTFMSGLLGTAFVPGRAAEQVAVFSSSMPQVIASALLLAFTSLLVVAAHFRQGKGEVFTLVRVAAALDKSDLPAEVNRFALDNGMRNRDEQALLEEWGDRKVSLNRQGGSVSVLHIDPLPEK